jgi:hypothetical protein
MLELANRPTESPVASARKFSIAASRDKRADIGSIRSQDCRQHELCSQFYPFMCCVVIRDGSDAGRLVNAQL